MSRKTNQMCEECFQELKINPKLLDDHNHAPFSPQNFVPFHAYTQKWAAARALEMEGEPEEEAWLPNEEEESEEEESEVPAAAAAQEKPEEEKPEEESEVPAVAGALQVNVSGVYFR